MRRNFIFLNIDRFLIIYKSMVRSHLEYAFVSGHHINQDIKKKLEKIQMKAAKLIKEIKHL